MNNYELSCLILIITLFFFSVDYLSDNQIIYSETKIGILSFLHHLFCIILGFGSILCLFFSKSLIMAFILILVSTIIQTGFLINNDYCWYTVMVNKIINPLSLGNRKWRGDYESLIKHYIRGDSWGYSDIYTINQTQFVICINIIITLFLLKINKQLHLYMY